MWGVPSTGFLKPGEWFLLRNVTWTQPAALSQTLFLMPPQALLSLLGVSVCDFCTSFAPEPSVAPQGP